MLSGAGVTREGYWRSDCVSPNYVGEYARYYSFVLTRARDVRIDLESPSVDTWLDLRQGAGTSGTVVETDNDGGTGTNALIDTRLDAGTYTIEATTLRTARSGPFTLTVRTSGDGSDRAALVALYEETNGSGWTNRTNWLSREPLSEWYGVSTNADGRVIEIDLDGNGLSGSIPGALRDIASLERLDLGPQPPDTPSGQPLFNMLTGPIPPELGSLTNLVFLDLGFNELSGPIPRELGSLVNLESLFLPDNRLSGQIPLELANLAKLEKLYLNKNTLTGPIPEWLGTLTNLRWLILGGSGLTGPVPRQLGNLADLERLGLWRLGLTGPMPLWLGTMGSLRSLSLSRNELTGGIPPELGDLVNLESLFLYENPLTGPVPRSLTQLSLGYFWIHATGACVPADTTFQAWVAAIENFRGDICGQGTRDFTDHPLVRGTTPIRAVHFRELRERIAALRTRESLAVVQWTDSTLSPGVTPVRQAHLMELRSALDAVYDAVGQSRPRYTETAVRAGVSAIQAVHIMELRAAIVTLE